MAVGREDPATASALVDRLEQRPGPPPRAAGPAAVSRTGCGWSPVDTDARRSAPPTGGEDEGGAEPRSSARLRAHPNAPRRESTAPSDLPPIAKELDDRIAAKTRDGRRGRAAPRIDHPHPGGRRLRLRRRRAGRPPALPRGRVRARLARGAGARRLAVPHASSRPRPIRPTPRRRSWRVRLSIRSGAHRRVPLLEMRYATSPYVAFLRGDEPYGYRELEDSLRTFALGPRRGARPAYAAARARRRDSLPTRPGAAPPPRRGLEP